MCRLASIDFLAKWLQLDIHVDAHYANTVALLRSMWLQMARMDRLKEEIGWLKVPFGLLAVVDASLLGWLAQSYTTVSPVLLLAASIAIIVVSGSMLMINRIAYRRINDLEEA